jgi:hypothetical protein
MTQQGGPFSSGLNRYSVGAGSAGRQSGGGGGGGGGGGRRAGSIGAASGGSFMGYVDSRGDGGLSMGRVAWRFA